MKDVEFECPPCMQLEYGPDDTDLTAFQDQSLDPPMFSPEMQHLHNAARSCARAATAAEREGHPLAQQAAYQALEACLIALARSAIEDCCTSIEDCCTS